MPLGMSVGGNIRELREANRGRGLSRPQRQILAIALSAARDKGAKIRPPPRKLGVLRQ